MSRTDVGDANGEPANVVDGLFAIARAIDRLADRLPQPAEAPRPAAVLDPASWDG